MNKKFWQGTNFWIALVLAIGGLFIGFPEGEARTLIAGLVGVIATAGLFREKLKGLQKVEWKTWLASKNTWNYLATAVVAVFPVIPAQLFTDLRNLIDAALGGNWQGIVTAVFSIATIIYYLVKGGK